MRRILAAFAAPVLAVVLAFTTVHHQARSIVVPLGCRVTVGQFQPIVYLHCAGRNGSRRVLVNCRLIALPSLHARCRDAIYAPR